MFWGCTTNWGMLAIERSYLVTSTKVSIHTCHCRSHMKLPEYVLVWHYAIFSRIERGQHALFMYCMC